MIVELKGRSENISLKQNIICICSVYSQVLYWWFILSAQGMDWSGRPGGEEEVKVVVAFLGAART